MPDVAAAFTTKTPPVTGTVTVPAEQTPELAVAKSVDQHNYATDGDMLLYSCVVPNPCNQTLTGITLADDAETVDCTPTVLPATLAPGASFTCTATHTITQADLDAGSLTNVATADSTQTPPVTDTVTVPAEQTPALAVAKSVDPDSYAAVGEVLTYTYVVTNTGNQTLTGITLADDAETVDCTPTVLPATLAPGASDRKSAVQRKSQADLDAGSLTNIATADSTQTPPVTDTVTVPAEQTPALALAKSVDPDSYAAVGEVLTYTYVVTNTGNQTLTGITLADDAETVDCTPTVLPATLAPGAEFTCTATHTVTQADLDAGSLKNVATADSAQSP